MKKLFLVFLMLLAGAAWAEWVVYNQSESSTHYFDPATIRKDGNMRRVWTIQNFEQRGTDGQMSNRAQFEYDCKEERYRFLDISQHSEPMAGGKVLTMEIGSGLWRGIAPGTISASMLDIVCAH
jgi:hypothetical protein